MATNKVNTSVEFISSRIPRIEMPFNVANDILEIVDSRHTEVGWIGEAERDANDPDLYRILKVTVPTQEASSATTEISGEGLLEVIEAEPDFDVDKFRYWGHSHGTIKSVTPSGQDNIQMKEFAESCKWFIGTIHNRDGDVYGYMVDMELGIYFKDIKIEIIDPPELEIFNSQIDELEMELDAFMGEYEKKSADLIKAREDKQKELIKDASGRDWAKIVRERVNYIGYSDRNKNKNGGKYFGTASKNKTPMHNQNVYNKNCYGSYKSGDELKRWNYTTGANDTWSENLKMWISDEDYKRDKKFHDRKGTVKKLPTSTSKTGKKKGNTQGEDNQSELDFVNHIKSQIYESPATSFLKLPKDQWEQWVDENIEVDIDGSVSIDGTVISITEWLEWKEYIVFNMDNIDSINNPLHNKHIHSMTDEDWNAWQSGFDL